MARTWTQQGDRGISIRLTLLIGGVAFMLGILAAEAIPDVRPAKGAIAAIQTRDPIARNPAVLPQEWAWRREPIDLDRMFRKK